MNAQSTVTTTRPPKFFGYGGDWYDDDCESRSQNRDTLRAYYRARCQLSPLPELGRHFWDRATELYTPLLDRDQGRRLFESLRPGDHLGCRLLHACRKFADTKTTLGRLLDLGVTIHVLFEPGFTLSSGIPVLSLDSGTEKGLKVFRDLIRWVDAKRRFTGQRTREALDDRAWRGEPHNRAWVGSRVRQSRNGDRYFVVDRAARKLGQLIVEWHDREGTSFERICGRLRRERRIDFAASTVSKLYWRCRAGWPINRYLKLVDNQVGLIGDESRPPGYPRSCEAWRAGSDLDGAVSFSGA